MIKVGDTEKHRSRMASTGVAAAAQDPILRQNPIKDLYKDVKEGKLVQRKVTRPGPVLYDGPPKNYFERFILFCRLLPSRTYEALFGLEPLPYPGKYDEFVKPAQGMIQIPELADGFNFSTGRRFGGSVGYAHSFTLGTAENDGYQLSVNTRNKLMSIGGRYTPAQNAVAGRVQLSLVPRVVCSVLGQAGGPDGQAMSVIEADMTNLDNHISARLQTADGSLRLTYAQSITRRVAAGLSMMYSHAQMGAGASAVAHWMHRNGWSAISLTMMPAQQAISVHHWRPWLYGLRFASEFQFAMKLVAPDEPPRWNTQFAVGWEYLAPVEERGRRPKVMLLKQSITSSGQVATFMRQSLAPHIEAEVSIQLDHKKGAFTLGTGLQWQF